MGGRWRSDGHGQWATPNLRGRQAGHGKTTRRSTAYPACVSQHAGLPDRHFSSTFIWRRRQQGAFISCGAAQDYAKAREALSAPSAAGWTFVVTGRNDWPEVRVFWAFQTWQRRSPRLLGVSSGATLEPASIARLRVDRPKMPVNIGLEDNQAGNSRKNWAVG